MNSQRSEHHIYQDVLEQVMESSRDRPIPPFILNAIHQNYNDRIHQGSEEDTLNLLPDVDLSSGQTSPSTSSIQEQSLQTLTQS